MIIKADRIKKKLGKTMVTFPSKSKKESSASSGGTEPAKAPCSGPCPGFIPSMGEPSPATTFRFPFKIRRREPSSSPTTPTTQAA